MALDALSLFNTRTPSPRHIRTLLLPDPPPRRFLSVSLSPDFLSRYFAVFLSGLVPPRATLVTKHERKDRVKRSQLQSLTFAKLYILNTRRLTLLALVAHCLARKRHGRLPLS